ncbi:MAG: 16S rRNA (uracil(1498)-N(3))-methyltransferase [Clostridiales bacterium]|nr:16S rRNA (uracil(1498)-N(3))-methyltransferase [Clostridiales bacterium]
MSKFFIPRENIEDGRLYIRGGDVSHITRVLRHNIGDEIVCCDGMGNDYKVKLSHVDKNQIICDIIEHKKSDTESDLRVILIQGVPKAAKMDYIIQKTTELGISEIYPCELSRCVAKINDAKKTERWQKIAREAAKQSGRGIIPVIHEPIKIDKAIDILKKSDVAFVPYECAEGSYLKPVLHAAGSPGTAAFLIGPEGGFDKQEINKISESGIPVISLGNRILRTETAGEAVLSMVMYEIGDING